MSSSSSSSSAPAGPSGSGAPAPRPLQYTLRSRAGMQSFATTPAAGDWGAKLETLHSGDSRIFEYNKIGTLLACVNQDAIIIYKANTGVVHRVIPRAGVHVVAFSPRSSYLVTWERLTAEANENKDNLIIWDIDKPEPVPLTKFTHKIYSPESWPPIKWTDDEVLSGRLVPGEVQVFLGAKLAAVVKRVKLPYVATFAWAPGPAPYKIAVFAPEHKSNPARVQVMTYPELGVVTASKSFFKADEAILRWNSTATAVLVQTSTDVDKTGKSYYGETLLWYVSADGSFTENIVLKKEGPIHDVCWSPLGKEFIVTYGFMPAQSTMFDLKARPVVDFGEAARNTIRWSPDGKIVCIGGFGNLQGSMDFWDVKNAAKIGVAEAHCAAICEWAPDSRHFIAAVISPRIRVDNGYKIIRFDGTLVFEAPVSELYQVSWQPAHAGAYPNAPLPAALKDAAKAPGSPALAASPAAVPAKPAAPSKYIPPHMKHRMAEASASPDVLHKDTNAQVKRYTADTPKASYPPGYYDDDDDEDDKKKKGKGKKKPAAQKKPEPEVEQITQEVEAVEVSSTPADPQKRIKALQKKLRQVEALQQKKATGAALNADELSKLATLQSIRDEIKTLGG